MRDDRAKSIRDDPRDGPHAGIVPTETAAETANSQVWDDRDDRDDLAGDTARSRRDEPERESVDEGGLDDIPDDDPAQAPDDDASDDETRNQATKLVSLALEQIVRLVHDADETAYAILPRDDHREVVRVQDGAFKRWLGHLGYRQLGKVLAAAVLTDAINTLEGVALHDGESADVYVRVAEVEDRLYLDLGDPDWSVVEITREGWCIPAESPVLFRRAQGMRPLPRPERGGAIGELREFVNVTDEDWPLVLGWLVQALRGRGPYPLLLFMGSHGSAKSTSARVLRSLVDPNGAPIRSEPASDRDLMITTRHSWVLAFDNLSRVPPWLSDALCRLSTGGGYATRGLYTNDDEVIFDAQRPVLLTGITDFVGRSDLRDRLLICETPAIEEGRVRTEREFWDAFERAAPRILGALLDALVVGLDRREAVSFDARYRMADFVEWAVACEPGLALDEGAILGTYDRSRETAIQAVLEENPLTATLIKLFEERGGLHGTATELLEQLNAAHGNDKPSAGWPKAPNSLSNALRRAQPDLRRVGIEVEFDRRPGERRRKTITISEASSKIGPIGPADPQIQQTAENRPSEAAEAGPILEAPSVRDRSPSVRTGPGSVPENAPESAHRPPRTDRTDRTDPPGDFARAEGKS